MFLVKEGIGNLHAILFLMNKKRLPAGRLQMYAFWTGLTSTFISLLHVIIIALKK